MAKQIAGQGIARGNNTERLVSQVKFRIQVASQTSQGRKQKILSSRALEI